MQTVACYLASASLAGYSTYLIRRTSPYSRCGGAAYEKRRQRRLLGEVLLIGAGIILFIGLLAQLDAAVAPQ